MALQINCADFGIDCSYVARANTEDELIPDIAKHGKDVHGYTDEQLNDPAMMEKIKALIKRD